MKVFSISLLVIVLISFPSIGGQFNGGIGFIHTNSALIMPPGSLDLSLYNRGYVNTLDVDGEMQITSNATSAFASTFGYSGNTEIAISMVLYQDLNQTFVGEEDVTIMTPGNVYFRLKFGGYPVGETQIRRKMTWGSITSVRLRVAKYSNVQYEPYNSDAIELELIGLLSYYDKPLYPEKGLNAHLNLGYINHNDGSTEDLGNVQSFNFLLSFLCPREKRFDFGAELYGSFFISKPIETVYARENWVYGCPFMKFNPNSNFNIILGLDYLLHGIEDETKTHKSIGIKEYPNYSTWRLTSRISFSPSTAFFQVAKEGGITAGRPRMIQTGDLDSPTSLIDRQAMFKWALEKRGGDLETIVDLDLEQIRQNRIQAEEELEQLKKNLEKKIEKEKE